MMIHILYTGKNGSAKAFAQEMVSSGVVEEIRNKEGNEGYSYFFPMEDEESVLLIDKWTNQQALDAHHQSDTMRKIMALREKYDLHMQVHRYEEIEQEERDQKYIR